MPPKPTVDKSFGMKNKKGGKAQKYIAQEAKSGGGKSKEEMAKEKLNLEKKREKEAALNKKKMEAELFKSALVQPKVPFGVDPKTVMCVFFKEGICEKGSRCKFSHDKNVERKVDKANIYSDTRDGGKGAPGTGGPGDKKDDTMDKWDEEKLRSVVTSKAGNPRTTTDIVCKYFIQAIEDSKYGWFWECPNGVDCKYRHALPPGFILKSEKKAMDELAKKEVISLEEFLETERHKLKAPLTPVTPESFAQWKKTRMDKKQAEAEAKEKAKAQQRTAGRTNGMSGRDMFTFGGFENDEEEGDDDEWDIQRYLAGRDQDARQTEDEEEEEGYRDGEDEDGDGEGPETNGNGVASEAGKTAGTDVNGVQEVLEKVKVTT